MTVPMERVEDRILTIRGDRGMVDTDLAVLYGVANKATERRSEEMQNGFRRTSSTS